MSKREELIGEALARRNNRWLNDWMETERLLKMPYHLLSTEDKIKIAQLKKDKQVIAAKKSREKSKVTRKINANRNRRRRNRK